MMDAQKIRLIALDLDGTLSQHKQHLEPANKEALWRLKEKYMLLMVGAGQTGRIFDQMEGFPVDIIGNYGLQYARYNAETSRMDMVRNESFPCDRAAVEARADRIRAKYGFTDFAGDSVEYHPSGCVTLPLLGTKAKQADKLAFDPTRVRRRAIYAEVAALFPDYNVFVGGSSSFDMAPKPYDKYYALRMYCEEKGLQRDRVVFMGDDYGVGGNDESVYRSDIAFLRVDDYRTFPAVAAALL